MPIRLSQTVKRLLIFYVAAFVVQQTVDQFMGGNLRSWFALIPALVLHGRIWQIFTYSFLHADVMHLVLNCMVLAFLGSDIEALWGTRKFLIFYFFCTLMAGLVYLVAQLLMWNPLYLSIPLVGASGGIYGLLAAYSILFAERELLFMMLFPLKAKQFIWLLAGIEFLQALFSGQGGLGAFAHLSGMGAGFLFLFLQARGFRTGGFKRATPGKKKPNHLRLIKGDGKEDETRGPRTWH
jgi:membrane associated rhomboid family serine protease